MIECKPESTGEGPTASTEPERVAVIVVNWNGWQYSLECLASLRTTVGVDWHMFLVDNFSTDESRKKLANLGDDVTLIESDHNSGWTGGNNLGIRKALELGYSYFLILNNDAKVLEYTILSLILFSKTFDVPPVVGPVNFDGTGETVDFLGAGHDERSGMPEFLNSSILSADGLEENYDTSFVKGSAMFISREHFQRVGLFDDRYYLNCDEVDWCYRARAAGYRVQMLRTSRILHAGSVSLGGSQSPLSLYFLTRNSLLFAETHSSSRQRFYHAMDQLRTGARLTGQNSILARLVSMLFGTQPQVAAWRMGVRDYALRRFGNCPQRVRELSNSR